MTWSQYLFWTQKIVHRNLIAWVFRFDLELKNWDIDTTQLKKPSIMEIIKWEKEKHKTNDSVSKAMFVNEYRDTVFGT